MVSESTAWSDINALVVGCGSNGRRHARVLRAMGVGGLRVCDRDADSVRALLDDVPDATVATDLKTALADRPDAVWVLTPPHTHVPIAIEALEAGCHVFCEKPVTDRLEGVDALRRRLEQSGRQFMVGLCFRFHAGLLLAHRWLTEGTIGRLVSIRALMGEPIDKIRPDYRACWGPNGNQMGVFDLIHEIDLAIWFANQPVREVHALYGSFSDIGMEAPDTAELLLKFGDRCLASIHLDFFQRPRRQQIELIGSSGTIIVEFAGWDRCVVSRWDEASEAWTHRELQTRRDDMFWAENTAFLRGITGQAPVPCSLEEALVSAEVVMRVLRE